MKGKWTGLANLAWGNYGKRVSPDASPYAILCPRSPHALAARYAPSSPLLQTVQSKIVGPPKLPRSALKIAEVEPLGDSFGLTFPAWRSLQLARRGWL
jgi:hypothetical protein